MKVAAPKAKAKAKGKAAPKGKPIAKPAVAVGAAGAAPGATAAPRSSKRRARLAITYIDPWSVLKVTAVLALCLAVVTIVAALVLTAILQVFGVFSAVNDAGSSVLGSDFEISPLLFIVLSAVVSLLNAVLFSALATVGTMLYNLAVRFVGGGIQAVLSDSD